jgi:hypothetical protein
MIVWLIVIGLIVFGIIRIAEPETISGYVGTSIIGLCLGIIAGFCVSAIGGVIIQNVASNQLINTEVCELQQYQEGVYLIENQKDDDDYWFKANTKERGYSERHSTTKGKCFFNYISKEEQPIVKIYTYKPNAFLDWCFIGTERNEYSFYIPENTVLEAEDW